MVPTTTTAPASTRPLIALLVACALLALGCGSSDSATDPVAVEADAHAETPADAVSADPTTTAVPQAAGATGVGNETERAASPVADSPPEDLIEGTLGSDPVEGGWTLPAGQ